MPPEQTLDPDDWDAFRAAAHDMLDAAITQMQTAKDGRVWSPLPDDQKAAFQAPLPAKGTDVNDSLRP